MSIDMGSGIVQWSSKMPPKATNINIIIVVVVVTILLLDWWQSEEVATVCQH